MIRYTVTARPEAEDDLARLWLRASDRSAIPLAASAIDQSLRFDAPQQGCEAGRGLRQLIVAPLIAEYAEYTVEDDDRLVTIWSFRHIGELTNGS